MPSNSPFIMHLTQQPPFIPDSAEVMVVTIELSPGTPGEPMLTLVSDRELAERRDRRAPRPVSS
jgi:hypothetical protein